MYRPLRLIVLFVLIVVCFAGVLSAQANKRDPAKESPIIAELTKIAPASVEDFRKATEALDSGDLDEAVRLYREVLVKAPNFEPALRRLGYSLVGTGKRDEGIASAQKALDLHRTSENLIGLAGAILTTESPEIEPTNAQIQRAFPLVAEAIKMGNPPDADDLAAYAQLALSLEKMEDFGAAVRQLSSYYQESPATHYFKGIDLANTGNFDEAVAEIRIAESLGLEPERAQSMIGAINAAKAEAYPLAPYLNYIWLFLGLVVAWVLGLLGLFVGGRIMSAQTLKAIEESDPNDVTGVGHSGLRHNYRRLISFAGFYYYLSQPIIIVLVLLFTFGTIYLFFWVGTIPIKLALVLAFVGLASVFFVVKSLIIRPKIEDPGRVLSESEAPRLWELVRNVATDINTRPIDEIRLTPTSELAVYERGGFRQKMRDKSERILIVGVASLNGFEQNAFRAVLAHEYGHFSNRDTAGGDIAFRVNSDIIRLAEAMGKSGTATIYNMAFQFIRLYHFLFRRITFGASRLQEVLADRVAIYHYGAPAFTSGLSHVIRRDVEFTRLTDSEVNAALADQRSFNNFYELTADEQASKDLEKEIADHINRPTTEDDSHPSPVDRMRLAEAITSKQVDELSGTVWELFDDREKIVAEMTKSVEQIINSNMYGT